MKDPREIERERKKGEKERRGACVQKIRGHCRGRTCSSLSRLVPVTSTRSRLSQVRDKKKDDRRRRRGGPTRVGRERGEGGLRVGRKSAGKKKKSRESEKANRKEERNGGPQNSLGSLPSGLVLAVPARSPHSPPSHRAFFFFSSSHCRFEHSFEQVRPPCFSSSARAPTALYACKQPSRVRIEKEESRERRRE